MTDTIAITRWANVKANVGTRVVTTWPAWLAELSRPVAIALSAKVAKRVLPAWSAASFRDDKRAKDACEGLCAVVFDYDKGTPTLDEARAFWSGHRAWLHTTVSHTDAAHRFRVVLPLSRLVTPAEFARIWTFLRNRAVKAGHVLDEATHDVSRLWFVPAHVVGGDPATVLECEGEPLDVDVILAELADAATHGLGAPALRAAVTAPNAGTPKRDRNYAVGALRSACESVRRAPEGTRNPTLNREAYGIAGLVAKDILDRDDAWRDLRSAGRDAGLTESEVAATLASAFEAGEARPREVPERSTRPKGASESKGGRGGGNDKQSRATELIDLARSRCELCRTDDGEPVAIVEVNAHRESWAIGSIRFRQWVTLLCVREIESAPNGEDLGATINTLSALARDEGRIVEFFVRVANVTEDGREVVYVDLGDRDWRAVRIDADGWAIVEDVPVCFRRTAGMLPLVEPVRGGTLGELRSFVRFASEDDYARTCAWLVVSMAGRGPFAVLVISGGQGTAKTSTVRILRSLIDPNVADTRSLPESNRDLVIAARNSYVQAYDNVSSLQPWLSDALARIATGDGFAARSLYTDGDEFIVKVRRPTILNGIGEFVARADLGQRSTRAELAPISKAERLPERVLDARFAAVRPRLLGALLDAVATGLRNLPDVQVPELPRMADFAVFAVAAEPAFGVEPGTFLRAFNASEAEGQRVAVERSVVGRVLIAWVEPWAVGQTWKGSTGALLEALERVANEKQRHDRAWPTSPQAMRSVIARLAPALEHVGIGYERSEREGHGRDRVLRITKLGGPADDADDMRTMASRGIVRSEASENTGDSLGADDADDGAVFSTTERRNGEQATGTTRGAGSAPAASSAPPASSSPHSRCGEDADDGGGAHRPRIARTLFADDADDGAGSAPALSVVAPRRAPWEREPGCDDGDEEATP